MPSQSIFHFGPYRLDGFDGQLWRHHEMVKLTPKAIAVLWCLAEQAGQVVTKDTLLDTVWAGTVVSEGVLTVCMREIRQALGDDARQPRYIETVCRRGYRLVALVETHLAHPHKSPASLDVPLLSFPTWFVGREAEIAQVRTCLERAQSGQRQMLFVTGEAGMGKTALVDTCTTALEAQDDVWIGRGQCVEHYGPGTGFLPILEALGRLCRGPGGTTVIGQLQQWAPTWLAQLGGMLPASEQAQLQRQTQGATRERLLRELAEALERLTETQLLVFVLEDLHWSDASTIEALTMVARRREAARLAILGTYRPMDLILREHPLKQAKLELQLHGQCSELPLPYLSTAAVEAYVGQRFPESVSAIVAPLVHQRTSGHPLFMVHLSEYVAYHEELEVRTGEEWVTRVAEVVQAVPRGVQQLIELQLERLTPDAQRVLEMASMVGVEFVVATLAAGLQVSHDLPESICEELVQQGAFLEACGLAVWPDGTVSGRYRFRHVLYQQVLYQRLAEVRRVEGHRRIGARLETGYGEQTVEIAAELAVHFERGRDTERALTYHTQAGVKALARFAYQEAINHLITAQKLFKTSVDTPARAHQELSLLVALGPALIVTKGQASADVERVYTRAYELYQQGQDTPHLFPILRGLWMVYAARGKFQTAYELGGQLFAQAQHTQDTALLLEAHRVLSPTLFFLGDITTAREHAEHGIALYEPQHHHALAIRYGQDSGVACLAFSAWALWHLGYPDQALRRSHEALALAQRLSHPHSLTLAHYFTAAIHQFRREVQAVQIQAEAAQELSTTHGFAWYAAVSAVQLGWVLAVQGQGEAGLAQMSQGLRDYEATGAALHRTYFLALLAETQAQVGQVPAGLHTLTDGFRIVNDTGERVHEAELHRLRGELLRPQADERVAAEACFQRAAAVARCQQAKSWELRAATSLARLWQTQAKRQDAYDLLAPVYGWFTEGFDTVDLIDAKTLLDELV